MESVEGLRRYRPYKLMNIASPYKKFYIFLRFLIFSIFRKNQNYPPVAQLQYMFFPCVTGKLNSLRGYWDTGRTNSWILQVHIRNFTFFSKISHFLNVQGRVRLIRHFYRSITMNNYTNADTIDSGRITHLKISHFILRINFACLLFNSSLYHLLFILCSFLYWNRIKIATPIIRSPNRWPFGSVMLPSAGGPSPESNRCWHIFLFPSYFFFSAHAIFTPTEPI